MKSHWLCARPGRSHRTFGEKNDVVCSAENASMDAVNITPDHSMAGHHAHSRATPRGIGVLARIAEKLGAGRGLRHGCESDTRIQLLSIFLLMFFQLLR